MRKKPCNVYSYKRKKHHQQHIFPFFVERKWMNLYYFFTLNWSRLNLKKDKWKKLFLLESHVFVFVFVCVFSLYYLLNKLISYFTCLFVAVVVVVVMLLLQSYCIVWLLLNTTHFFFIEWILILHKIDIFIFSLVLSSMEFRTHTNPNKKYTHSQ